MPKTKPEKRISLLVQIALLFAVGVFMIGSLTTFAVYQASTTHYRNSMRERALATAKDVENGIARYPAHEWLIRLVRALR